MWLDLRVGVPAHPVHGGAVKAPQVEGGDPEVAMELESRTGVWEKRLRLKKDAQDCLIYILSDLFDISNTCI